MPSRAEPIQFDSDLGVYGVPGSVYPWDIRFDPDDRAFCDRLADGSYRLRVWAESGLGKGLIVAGAMSRPGRGHPLEVVAVTERFVYWETKAELAPGEAISAAFTDPAGMGVYRVPSGISAAVERLDRWVVPDLAPLTVAPWAQGTVIYQIFPDRFADGDPDNNPPGTAPWGSEPTPHVFQGGDLAGITARLDHLVGLGVDTIYLNPIATAPSTHRYDTVDHHHVDPALGGDRAFEALVEEAHSRGLRVMADIAINHVHPTFPQFADVIALGPKSDYADWFVVHDHPARLLVDPDRIGDDQRKWINVWQKTAGLSVEETMLPRGPAVLPTYDAWLGVPTMPRIDLSHPAAREYMLDVLTSWVRRFDIDAWRMDVARHVDSDVWPGARRRLRALKPEFHLLAEIMGGAGNWLQGDGFDATMNYTFRDLAIGFCATETIDGAGFSDGFARTWAEYAWPVTLANHNLIGSHDTPRFLTVAGGDIWRLQLATVLQLTLPGAPGVYYGDEIGLQGGPDPGCRGAFPWHDDPLGHPVAETIASLTLLRRRHPALVSGEWRPIRSAGDVVAFRRIAPEETVTVVVNRGVRPAKLPSEITAVLWPDPSLAQVPPQSAVIGLGSPLGQG